MPAVAIVFGLVVLVGLAVGARSANAGTQSDADALAALNATSDPAKLDALAKLFDSEGKTALAQAARDKAAAMRAKQGVNGALGGDNAAPPIQKIPPGLIHQGAPPGVQPFIVLPFDAAAADQQMALAKSQIEADDFASVSSTYTTDITVQWDPATGGVTGMQENPPPAQSGNDVDLATLNAFLGMKIAPFAAPTDGSQPSSTTNVSIYAKGTPGGGVAPASGDFPRYWPVKNGDGGAYQIAGRMGHQSDWKTALVAAQPDAQRRKQMVAGIMMPGWELRIPDAWNPDVMSFNDRQLDTYAQAVANDPKVTDPNEAGA